MSWRSFIYHAMVAITTVFSIMSSKVLQIIINFSWSSLKIQDLLSALSTDWFFNLQSVVN